MTRATTTMATTSGEGLEDCERDYGVENVNQQHKTEV